MREISLSALRAAAKLFNKHKGNVAAAAVEAHVGYSTFKYRIAEGQIRYPKLFKDFAHTHKGATPLDETVAHESWRAFQESGHNIEAAAKLLNKPRGTIRNHITTYARRHGIDLKLLQQPAPKTMVDHVAEHREHLTESASKAKLKDAARTIVELEDRIKDMEWAAKAELTPAEWTLPTHPRVKREHMPYLLTSDFQIGEVIKAEETEAGYGFDSSIFRKRYRQMIDTTIYLSFEHAGTNWKFPGIIYARGGDTISGAIHDELKETDDLTPIEAVECAFEEESAGIGKLADAFGRVDVKSFAGGNHDRNLIKPTTKKASAHSYDRLIEFMLRREFNKDARVHFQTSRSFDIRFNIYDLKIVLTHGDRMGSSGGQGFIGPLATIMRGVQKVIMEQAALGFNIDRVDHGHYHTPAYGGWFLSNGCMPGYSEYAKQFRMRPSPPQQSLLYHHPRRGVVDIKPIILTETK